MHKIRFSTNLLVIVTLITALNGSDFVHRDGRFLVVGASSDTVLMRGINFNNWWLAPLDDGDWTHYDPNDSAIPQPYAFGDSNWVAAAATMGSNVIRIGLTYRLFEDNASPYVYKESGFAVIDQYVTWAQIHNLYLILDMHVPPGGMQNTEYATNLWLSQDKQDRLTALWKAIAARYADEPRIAAYDLLNEPTPLDTVAAWSDLAQRLADSIRVVDQNHLLIVEYAYGVLDSTGNRLPFWDLSRQMFLINDENTMYDFHYYQPQDYALQCYGSPDCPDGYVYGDTSVTMEAQGWVYPQLTRAYLEYDFPEWLNFFASSNVPVNIGEWAPWHANFTYNDNALQGYEYMCDLLDIMDQYQVSWQYYCYDEFISIAGLNTRLSNFLQSGSCSVNAPPVAVADIVTTDEDSALIIHVLTNDSDPELDPLTIQSVITTGTHGQAVKDAGDTTITYTPDLDYFGPDTLVYVITDGVYTDTAAIYLTVLPVNDAPDPFALLNPRLDTLIHRVNDAIWDTVVFRWAGALDVEGDNVTYHFADVSENPLFASAPTADTTLYLTPGIVVLGINYAFKDTVRIVWNVSAHDGVDSTVASNGPYTFVLIIDYSNLSTDAGVVLPSEFALHQNYPNPFNPTTAIRYDLPQAAHVRLGIYDLLGREVIQLVNGSMEGGYHHVVWNARDANGRAVSTGMYIVVIMTSQFTRSIKIVLLK